MFSKMILAAFALVMMGSSALANDNGGGGLGDLVRQVVRPSNNGYFQCEAYNRNNSHHIYTGEVAYGKHQAKDSALHECEDSEGHHASCRVYRCFRVNGGGHGGGHGNGNGHGNGF